MRELKNVLAFLFRDAKAICLVGGAVIDHLSGRTIKDWDIEIYGLSLQTICNILEKNGYPADMVGASFGIIKTKIAGIDIDVSVPRRENKIGKGHKGFAIYMDPDMTIREAARRRDLTINSISLCLKTGEILDPFNGLEDLAKGCIRHVDATTFVEDPLRVLRIMQLLPRKGSYVDMTTIELSRSIVDSYSEIPKERVFGEFEKLLLKSQKPSMGLRFLVDSGWIKHFPELKALMGCPQNPEWHPEGDVWEHTLQAVDNAAKMRKYVPDDWRLPLMFGALCHDMGKPAVTTSDLRAIGHDKAGVLPAIQFMSNLTDNKKLIERVANIVENHMQPGNLYRGEARNSRWLKLHKKVPLEILGALSRCDSLAKDQHPADIMSVEHPVSSYAWERAEIFRKNKTRKAVITGKDLINAGFVPGPEFKHMIEFAEETYYDDKLSKEELLKVIIFGNRELIR